MARLKPLRDRDKLDILHVRLQEGEKGVFERAAVIAGLTLSDWVRMKLRRAAMEDLSFAGEAVKFYPPAAK